MKINLLGDLSKRALFLSRAHREKRQNALPLDAVVFASDSWDCSSYCQEGRQPQSRIERWRMAERVVRRTFLYVTSLPAGATFILGLGGK